jgi:hypothetical protein
VPFVGEKRPRPFQRAANADGRRDMIRNVIGPYVIFDKSAIQMLTADEIEELTHHFNFICVPTLMREIIADLHKRPGRSSRIPEGVVRALAGRIGRMHPMTPPNFRRMAISNLFGSPVPVDGRVPIDITAPQVTATDRIVSYDATLEQRIWQRWAGGNFSGEDLEVGHAWRAGLEIVNLKALGKDWQRFLDSRIGRAESLQDAVARVDHLMRQPLAAVQSDLLAVLIVFLRAPAEAGARFVLQYALGGPVTISDVAPYASAVLRLYLERRFPESQRARAYHDCQPPLWPRVITTSCRTLVTTCIITTSYRTLVTTCIITTSYRTPRDKCSVPKAPIVTKCSVLGRDESCTLSP